MSFAPLQARLRHTVSFLSLLCLALEPAAAFLPVFVPVAYANVTVTAATGGAAIPSITAGGTFTALTGPSINEGTTGDIGVGTIILNAPAGFEFDTEGVAPTVKLTSGNSDPNKNTNHITNNTAVAVDSVSSTQITFTITFASNSSEEDKLTWQNVRVRPTAPMPLASGDITMSGTSSVAGVTGSTNFGTLTEIGATITPATGGSAIDAATAGDTFTSLTGPMIEEESASGEIGAGTLVLTVPDGFEFDTGGTAPTVRLDRTGGGGPNSCNINGAADNSQLSVTSYTTTQITFTVISPSLGGVGSCTAAIRNKLTWQNLRVRPTAASPLASGNLFMDGTSAVTGVDGSTNFGTLTEVSVTITPATGGEAIPSDTAGGTYTTLTGPTITEDVTDDITNGTIILNAPDGFEFDDTGSPAPTVLITRTFGTGGNDRNINGLADGTHATITSRSPEQITFTVTDDTDNGVENSVTWENVRVRPTAASPLASGNITVSGTSGITGVTPTTNFGTLTEIASTVPTTTSLESSLNPSTYGQDVTFTATVVGSSPTGTAQFKDGISDLGAPVALAGGQAQLTLSSLTVGSHSITAEYSGDPGNDPSTSAPLDQTVDQATLTVAADSTSRAYGVANPTFTATTTGFVNGEDLASSGVTGAPDLTCAATETSPVSGSPYAIVATIGSLAASNYTFTFVDGALAVTTASSSTTTVLNAPSTSVVGDAVTLSASVSGDGTLEGTVQFSDDGAPIGAPVPLVGGTASLSWTFTVVGDHNLSAAYSGDDNHSGSTSATSVLQVVEKDSPVTSTAIGAPNSSIVGEPATFTATVTSGYNATGTVEFLDNGIAIGTGALVGDTATFTTSNLAVGDHPMRAHYLGDANNNESTSSEAVTQVVEKDTPVTSTVLGAPASPVVVGTSVTFTATVTSGFNATGTVEFLDNGLLIGTGLLDGAGAATLTTSTLTVGDHPMTAHYLGDANNNGSTSATAVVHVVSKASSTTTLSSNHNPSVYNQSVTFTAVVTGYGSPEGTVRFLENGSVLSTSGIIGGQAQFATSSLSVGTHVLTAIYDGDANNNESTSGELTQTVNQSPTTTVLTATPDPAMEGATVTFTATVTGVSPSGTVTFKEGGTDLGTGIVQGDGTATLQISSLSGGGTTHSVTARYEGDTNNLPSDSAAASVTVNSLPRLTVTKVVVNDNGGTKEAADFQLFVDGYSATFGDTASYAEGSHTLSEGGATGYSATYGGDCAGSATITLTLNDVKSCTITNDDIQPKLTVTKTVVNDHGGTMTVEDFPLFVDATSLTSGVQTGIDAGTRTVSETSSSQYAATIGGDCAANGTITLQPGDVKACTVTNDDIAPRVLVQWTVTRDNGGTDLAGAFGVHVGESAPENGETLVLSVGSYPVTTTHPTGYTVVLGGDCAGGNLSLALAEEKTCTATFDDIQPKLTVTKTVVNDNNGTKTVADFPLFVDETSVASGVQTGINAGTRTVSEGGSFLSQYATTFGGDCAADGSVTLLPGDEKSCTVVNNDKQATLFVVINVHNNTEGTNVPADFTPTVLGTNPSPVTFAGESGSGTLVSLDAGAYEVTERLPANYRVETYFKECKGSILPGQTIRCVIDNIDVPLDKPGQESPNGGGSRRHVPPMAPGGFGGNNQFPSSPAIPPGGFGGSESQETLTARQKALFCRLKRRSSPLTEALIKRLTTLLSRRLHKSSAFIEGLLQDPAACQ